jgi:hypothetical protein
MSDEHELSLRQADQARTDFAAIESDLEFLMLRINQLPTASDLWRAAMPIGPIGAVLGIIGIEAFWRYFPCGPADRGSFARVVRQHNSDFSVV